MGTTVRGLQKFVGSRAFRVLECGFRRKNEPFSLAFHTFFQFRRLFLFCFAAFSSCCFCCSRRNCRKEEKPAMGEGDEELVRRGPRDEFARERATTRTVDCRVDAAVTTARRRGGRARRGRVLLREFLR